jgi:hypothetical protein
MALTTAQAFYVGARRAFHAWFVRFDPTDTTLEATNVQDAIEELANAAPTSGTDILQVQVFS